MAESLLLLPVEESVVGRVIAYVENNPVRAGMVECAQDFEWSSARAHLGEDNAAAMLDMEWWEAHWTSEDWRAVLRDRAESAQELRDIRQATCTGRPLGSKQFIAGLEENLGRVLEVRPGGRAKQRKDRREDQLQLWSPK